MSKRAVLYRMVMDDHICPFGMKSKDLLERQGYEVEDHHLSTREQTDAFKAKHDVKTTPQTFIDGKRIGGHDDLLAFFGKAQPETKGTSYQPVIAVFSVTFLMALALSYTLGGGPTIASVLTYFVGFSMCVLSILKLQDLFSFTNQFIISTI